MLVSIYKAFYKDENKPYEHFHQLLSSYDSTSSASYSPTLTSTLFELGKLPNFQNRKKMFSKMCTLVIFEFCLRLIPMSPSSWQDSSPELQTTKGGSFKSSKKKNLPQNNHLTTWTKPSSNHFYSCSKPSMATTATQTALLSPHINQNGSSSLSHPLTLNSMKATGWPVAWGGSGSLTSFTAA